MEYAVIGGVAFLASGFTLFSGFGLSTILVPVFAVFFPVPVAVAAAAVVHLLNNLFKLFLVGKFADKKVVIRFAVPAAFAAAAGAVLLTYFATIPEIGLYRIGGAIHRVTPLKLLIGVLVVGFSLAELPSFSGRSVIPSRYLPLGGLLSGFFGGLSGNQGAFRSMFLIQTGLSKEAFIGTSVVASVIVDIARLFVYGMDFRMHDFAALKGAGGIVLIATLAAFTGAAAGNRLIGKVTYRSVRFVVAVMLVAVGLALAAGFI
jgi:uncharacterized membrane protein YfcA